MTRSLLRSAAPVALALASIALSACANPTGAPAATVGGVEISDERLASDIVAFRFLAELSGGTCGTPVSGESAEAACARFTLTNVIQEEIAKAYASSHRVTVGPTEVADAIAQLEQNLGGADALDGRLKDAGLSRAGFQSLAERLVLFSDVEGAVVDDRLDDGALRALYEQSKPQFTTVEVAHILLGTRAEAERVAAEATPENFAKLAKQRSTDTASASKGGDLGSLSEAQFRQQFDPTFVKAALALVPGQISGVVHTQFGYHVIELIRRDVAAFGEVRDQLSAQQAPQVFRQWLQERLGAADIEINPRYGRFDASTGEVVAIRSTADPSAATGGSGASGASGATGAASPSP